MSAQSIISRGKDIIRVNDIKELNNLYKELGNIIEDDYQLSGAYIYQ